jgi:hypothetical protein
VTVHSCHRSLSCSAMERAPSNRSRQAAHSNSYRARWTARVRSQSVNVTARRLRESRRFRGDASSLRLVTTPAPAPLGGLSWLEKKTARPGLQRAGKSRLAAIVGKPPGPPCGVTRRVQSAVGLTRESAQGMALPSSLWVPQGMYCLTTVRGRLVAGYLHSVLTVVIPDLRPS